MENQKQNPGDKQVKDQAREANRPRNGKDRFPEERTNTAPEFEFKQDGIDSSEEDTRKPE